MLKSYKNINEIALINHWVDSEPTGAEGWLVIDNLLNGISGGGTFMSEDASLNEVKDLAKTMTKKNSLQDIPFGGGKAGIKFNPKDGRANDVLKRFYLENKKFIEKKWCTGADINTNNNQINFIFKKYLDLDSPFLCLMDLIKKHDKRCETIKTFEDRLFFPLNKYFSLEEGITGFAVSQIIKETCKKVNCPPPKVLIQGFGKVGSSLAYFLHQENIGQIVGICEIDEFVYNPEGINPIPLIERKIKKVPLDLCKYKGKKGIYGSLKSTDNLLKDFISVSEFDLFLPCSVRYVIDEYIARLIKKKSQKKNIHIVAGSNNICSSYKASKILEKNNILLFPEWFSSFGNAILFQESFRCIEGKDFTNHIKNKIKYKILNFIKLNSNNQIVLKRHGV